MNKKFLQILFHKWHSKNVLYKNGGCNGVVIHSCLNKCDLTFRAFKCIIVQISYSRLRRCLLFFFLKCVFSREAWQQPVFLKMWLNDSTRRQMEWQYKYHVSYTPFYLKKMITFNILREKFINYICVLFIINIWNYSRIVKKVFVLYRYVCNVLKKMIEKGVPYELGECHK